MGFTDLISSSRGPGVIGTFVALIVLGGFGLLFVFVFDEGMQGNGVTIESVIHKNADEIASSNVEIARRNTVLESVPALAATAKEADALKNQNSTDTKVIESTQATLEQTQQSLAALQTAMETYADSYRASIRGAAVGQELPELKTASGVTYTGVKIRKVDPVGMQITHSGGLVRIPYEELPADMQDLYQFTADKKDQTRKHEHSDLIGTDLAVKISDAESALVDKRGNLEKLLHQIDTDKASIEAIKLSTPKRKADLAAAKSELNAERNKPLSHFPAMEIKFKQKEADWAAVLGSIPIKEQAISKNQAAVTDLKNAIHDNEATIKALYKEAAAAAAVAPK
jgi:chromosome segregation ATPase